MTNCLSYLVARAQCFRKCARRAKFTVKARCWAPPYPSRELPGISNASRTMLVIIQTGDWDDKLLKLFGGPGSMLPEVRSSSEVYGESTMLGASIPIAGIAGDQQRLAHHVSYHPNRRLG